MLLKDTETSEEFLRLFRKKFDNFCQKAPILISYQANNTHVLLQNIYSREQHLHNFDYTKDVSENIKEIKDFLLDNWYPVMESEIIETIPLSDTETEQMIEQGVSIEEAVLSTRTEKTVVPWRIEKILVRKDEIFVRNLVTDRFFRFKMHMPVTIFLKRLREKYNPAYAFKVFLEKSEKLNEIYKDYNPDNPQE